MRRIALIVSVLLLVVLPVAAQDGDTYTDPQGRYTLPIPTNWTVTESETGDYILLTDPDEQILVYFATFEAGEDLQTPIDKLWALVDPEFDLPVQTTQEITDEALLQGYDANLTVIYDTGDVMQLVVASNATFEDIAYVSIVEAPLAAIQQRAAQLQQIVPEITAMESEDLTDAAVLPVDAAMLAEVERIVEKYMAELDIPGAAVAVVQGGEVVYAEGFGVKDRETGEPITPQTYMMIGSTTKTMTTMAMATLVDDGLMNWDTPVVDILPSFAVADPEMTEQITVENLVCACTGVPRRDYELIFNYGDLTAENIVEQLATFEFFTDFGEAFQYSNQMVAAGGYVAAAADGAAYGNLFDGYVDLMQSRIFDPIGMAATTFDFDRVVTSGDYATPYGITLDNEFIAIPLTYEAFGLPIAPAGAVWSTLDDMTRYVMTAINVGVTPDGTRVVSEDNLRHTWEPQVPISNAASYGLGWIIEDYNGVPIYSHDGNMLGFTAGMAFLPQGDTGIIVLTNGRATNQFNQVVRERLLELIFDREARIEAQFDALLGTGGDDSDDDSDDYGELDTDLIENYLGEWTNDALGTVTLSLTGGNIFEPLALVLDAGEFQVEIRNLPDAEDESEYYTFETPLEGLPVFFNEDDNGSPIFVIGSGLFEYTFTPVE